MKLKSIVATMGLFIVVGGAAMAAGGAQSVPVNLTVDKYAYAYFPASGDQSVVDYATYSADPINNKSAFSIDFTANDVATDGTAYDTVNMAWGCNTPTNITVSLDKGTLPGTWSMEFDGAGVTGPSQTFTTDTKDIGHAMAVPVKLMVTGIDLGTTAGSYAGTLNIVSVTPL